MGREGERENGRKGVRESEDVGVDEERKVQRRVDEGGC